MARKNYDEILRDRLLLARLDAMRQDENIPDILDAFRKVEPAIVNEACEGVAFQLAFDVGRLGTLVCDMLIERIEAVILGTPL